MYTTPGVGCIRVVVGFKNARMSYIVGQREDRRKGKRVNETKMECINKEGNENGNQQGCKKAEYYYGEYGGRLKGMKKHRKASIPQCPF